jgi:pyruvate/2-oxoglutarate dehydrogenase complex dihydrolipoamide acyltransferase (E2) component
MLIVNLTQAAILYMYTAKDKPVFTIGHSVVRPIMAALIYDHWLMDGPRPSLSLVRTHPRYDTWH